MSLTFRPLSQAKRKLIGQLKTKKGRQKHHLFLGEGWRFIETALASETPVHSVYLREDMTESLSQWAHSSHLDEVYLVPPREFSDLSDTVTPQGILALFPWEERELSPLLTDRPPVFVAIDAVQDAGNLGTIIRTALSLGIDHFLLGRGTVEPYNPKVVRATMGALFSAKWAANLDLVDTLDVLGKQGYHLYPTLPRGGTCPEEVEFTAPCALVLGNEGAGLADELASLGVGVTIPQSPHVESLNVNGAASILLYQVARKLGLV